MLKLKEEERASPNKFRAFLCYVRKYFYLCAVRETSNIRYKTFNADCSETGKLNYLNQNALIVCIYVYILCIKIWVQTYNCI